MNNLLRIALMDLLRVAKDKQTVFWMLLMPLVFVFMFGQMIPDQSNNKVWLPVFNRDDHELAQLFVAQLQDEKFNINIRDATDEQYVKNWPRAMIIPATFSVDILNGEQVDVTFVQGKGNFEQTLSAQTHVVNTLVKFIGSLSSVDVFENRWTDLTKERFEQALHQPNILQVEEKKAFSLRKPPSGYGSTLPAYLIMFVMMNTLLYGGITLVHDRENHQMMRLESTPTSPLELFSGKLLGRVFVPVIQAALLLTLGNLLFSVSLGDHPWALLPVVISFAFCCGSLGVLFGFIFANEQQLTSVSILATMILSAMGGCWWPMEIIPDAFKTVAQFTPTYWGLQGLYDVMAFGKSISGVWIECTVLIAFAVVFTALALYTQKHKTVS